MANLYKRYQKVFTGATTESLLTVPDATSAIVRSIIVANTTGSSINVTAAFSPLGTGATTIAPALAVATNSYVDLLAGKVAGPLILEATDILKITSSAADLSVTVSALLVDRN
jgi:hypothetical protein